MSILSGCIILDFLAWQFGPCNSSSYFLIVDLQRVYSIEHPESLDMVSQYSLWTK